ncbi:MAG: hypothetical protein P4M11_12720, partial [Candidatus Pacebacteria bacterium]|nr:hypothetical protein [Candidatus Paceibacterota bacterium]
PKPQNPSVLAQIIFIRFPTQRHVNSDTKSLDFLHQVFRVLVRLLRHLVLHLQELRVHLTHI